MQIAFRTMLWIGWERLNRPIRLNLKFRFWIDESIEGWSLSERLITQQLPAISGHDLPTQRSPITEHRFALTIELISLFSQSSGVRSVCAIFCWTRRFATCRVCTSSTASAWTNGWCEVSSVHPVWSQSMRRFCQAITNERKASNELLGVTRIACSIGSVSNDSSPTDSSSVPHQMLIGCAWNETLRFSLGTLSTNLDDFILETNKSVFFLPITFGLRSFKTKSIYSDWLCT